MLSLTLVGGPTAVIEFSGVRWLTDPTFSEPGEYSGLVKTSGPAMSVEQIGPVDVVLLSHDQHSDNLDPAGREMLADVPLVLTTTAGAERLGVAGGLGLEPWETTTGNGVEVMAVPALHGPPGGESQSGPVIGFVLSDGENTVYVSGDNASVDVVAQVAARWPHFDVAVLFAGGVQIARRFDGAYLTLSSDRAAQAAEILGAEAVIPLHFEGWTHFLHGAEQLRDSFAGYGIAARLRMPERGVRLQL
jgi:L-ascorbate metabolism protein UlaG (beta-lactamase superfamily)